MKDAFLRFIWSPRGRITRVVGGALLLVVGLATFGTMLGKGVALASLLPLASGLTNRCVLPQPNA